MGRRRSQIFGFEVARPAHVSVGLSYWGGIAFRGFVRFAQLSALVGSADSLASLSSPLLLGLRIRSLRSALRFGFVLFVCEKFPEGFLGTSLDVPVAVLVLTGV